jgi:hypothetical protein
MGTLALVRFAVGTSVAAVLVGCGGSQPPMSAPGATHQSSSSAQAILPDVDKGPFLYVGGHTLSMYALGYSEPLRSAKRDDYVTRALLAFDRHGHLCEANGDISAEQFLTYDARTLKLLHVLNGTGAFDSLVSDRLGYVYAGADVRIYVYAPGCERVVNIIRRGYGAVRLAFDHAGNLYAQGPTSVSVFAPTQTPGHMKFVRRITDGLNNPGALAIGPSGNLFVANWTARRFPKHAFVAVYKPGGSVPVRRITEGLKVPWTLAADSKGRLYVANTETPYGGRSWISVYAPGATQPMNEIVDGINTPSSLAIDPSDNLYVMNQYLGIPKGHQTVTVYAPGGTKLLQTITKGAYGGQSLVIGSP